MDFVLRNFLYSILQMNRGLDCTCYPWLGVRFQFSSRKLFNRNVLVYRFGLIYYESTQTFLTGLTHVENVTCQSIAVISSTSADSLNLE